MKKIDYMNNLNLAKKAARYAGSMLFESFNHPKEKIFSSDKDIKLSSDIEAEECIKEIIQNESDLPILAEESGKSSKNLTDTFWVIDPLDGTANYERKIPVSCVSIAIVSELEPVLGVIYDFNNNLLYEGSKFSEAKVNEKSIQASNIQNKNEGVLLTGLPNNTDYSNESLKIMIDDFQNWRKVRMIGSAGIASIYVASGKADLYKEKKTYLWDIAAGAAIANSAGCNVKISKPNNDFQVDISISNGKIND
jgi:myo-inositol-1(or 4)-monophosphatase